MKLRIALSGCALIAALGAGRALYGAELTPGRDYHSVQLLSAKSAAALQPALASVADQPDARIDRRGADYILRVGFWQSRGEAEQAARALRPRFAGAHARIAAYRPELIVAAAPAGPGASVPPASGSPVAAGEAPAQSNVLSSRSSEQRNVLANPEIPRNTRAPVPAQPQPQSALPRARAATAPNQAPLWALLGEHRYAELQAELVRLRKIYPAWSPPARLLALREEGETSARIAKAIADKDWQGLVALAGQHPRHFDCSHIDFLWGLAEAHHALGNAVQTLATYQRILPSCPKSADRIATLYKARSLLGAQDYAALLEREARAQPREPGEQAKLEQITYEYRLGQFLQAVNAKDTRGALALIGSFESMLRARRDARNATLAGWVYFDSGQFATAADWFDSALGWEPADEDARYGLALANFRLQRLDAAEAALQNARADDARNRALRGEILYARAAQAYEGKRYAPSLDYLAQAEAQGKSGREVSMLRAWNDYQLGNDAEAAQLFIAAYRAQPDAESAQGAVLSMSRAGRWDELETLSQSLGAPFKGQWQAALAQRFYGRKLFLAAEAASPGHFPQLQNIAAPSLALGGMLREKSGADGTSRLRMTKAPYLEGTLGLGVSDELRMRLYRVGLDSGSAPPNAMIGSFPAAGGYVTSPTTRLASGLEPHLSYRHEGWLTTYAGIGMTPSGGVLPSAPTANLGFLQQLERGNWRAELFSEPVRESILSYTGIVDPYTGQSWGRVRRSGAFASGYTALGGGWGGSGKLQVMDLEGRGVASNQGLTANLSVARNLGLREFEYFSVGPDLSYDAYRKNLSHFTLGHGGYFSPERLVSLGVSAHFLTAEARQYIIKGDASIGVYDKREAASPCFPLGAPLPLNPGCSAGYAATHASGAYYALELIGVRRLSDNLQVGGGVIVRRNAQYDDKAAMVFLRYVFGPRSSVMSSDLPIDTFHSLY